MNPPMKMNKKMQASELGKLIDLLQGESIEEVTKITNLILVGYPAIVLRVTPDGGLVYYFAYLPDFGYSACSAVGDTIDETLASLIITKDEVAQHYIETGRDIPRPFVNSKSCRPQILNIFE